MKVRIVGILFLTLIGCMENREHTGNKPNILWIVGENIALDLGCYGATNVSTPNLDRLAGNGVRFTRVFTTSPVCAPSRSAFMTGMYQTTTGTHNMRSHRKDDFKLPEGVRPLTHRLQDAGYFTANIKTIGTKVVGTGKLDLNFVNEGPIFESDSWEALKDHQPFYAQINTPEVEYDIYDRKSAEKERVKWVGEDEHEQIATPENVTPPPYYPDHEITREEWARYLNSVSGMDKRVGVILDQLRKDGLLENTIVIFFADNGRLEARGIHWLWDSGIHVPMIISWPKNFTPPLQYRPGKVIDQVISLLDITATTLEFAGIPKPEGMQSRIFMGKHADPAGTFAVSARDRIDETVIRLRSVREKKYHYIRNFSPGKGFPTLNRYKEKCFLVKPLMRKLYAGSELSGPAADLMKPMPPELLYNTETDPYEIHNLADSHDPADREALVRLRGILDQWMEETRDLGSIPEPPEIYKPFEKEMDEWFGTPGWYRKGN